MIQGLAEAALTVLAAYGLFVIIEKIFFRKRKKK